MKFINFLLLLISITLMASCGDKLPKQQELPKMEKIETASETMSNLRMVRWELSDYSYQGMQQAATKNDKDKISYLILREGKASGFAGCSNFVGKYEEGVDYSIRFIDIKAPNKSCKGMAVQQTSFLTLLKTALSYEVSESGKKMTIKCLEGELHFSTQK